MTLALAPGDRRRLAGVLARLASNHAGERDAAALLASRIVRDRDLTWLDVLQVDLPVPAQEPTPPCRGTDLALCLHHLSRLSSWEREFVQSVARVLRRTPGQSRKLSEIADALRKNGAK